MSYKTILVHVDGSRNANVRIELAARLAVAEDAHLIGAAPTDISRVLYETAAFAPGMPDLEPFLNNLRQRAHDNLNKFEEMAQRLGVKSFEKRTGDDEAASSLSLQARYCDLVILGQYDPDEITPSVYADLPEFVVMNGDIPALIVPYIGVFPQFGERVLIAWNESIEAGRAVRHALPLLRHAKMVEILMFNSATDDSGRRQPGADIALYLARHNIQVNIRHETTESETANALLSRAADLSADLLVMGCYGHSRLREIILGGMTRTVLQSMTLPVLMAH